MLTYAFQNLTQTNYEHIAGEKFDNIFDLLAEILLRGVSQQIKQGLYREYVDISDNISSIKGKVVINNTIKDKISRKPLVYCEYNELTENNIYNQIIKSTILYLIRRFDVEAGRKANLKQALLYLAEVDDIDPSLIKWNGLQYQRSNRTYQMLINICYFILKNQLFSEEKGTKSILNFADENMARLYEKFILEYYRKHHPELKAKAKHIEWAINENDLDFMPKMITDIYLRCNNKVLIIDAKYYGKTMQERFGKQTFHSNNIFQIQSYVNNEAYLNPEFTVSGMLLYAKTNEDITPNKEISIAGHEYAFKTLDLNTDFDNISSQLESIIQDYFKS